MFSVHCARSVMVTYCYIQGIRRSLMNQLTPQPPWAYYSEIPGDIRVRIRIEGKESFIVLCARFFCQRHSVVYSLLKLQPQLES